MAVQRNPADEALFGKRLEELFAAIESFVSREYPEAKTMRVVCEAMEGSRIAAVPSLVCTPGGGSLDIRFSPIGPAVVAAEGAVSVEAGVARGWILYLTGGSDQQNAVTPGYQCPGWYWSRSSPRGLVQLNDTGLRQLWWRFTR